MTIWAARLESLLQAELTQLDWAAVTRLVELRVREDADLDFKADVYGNGDSAKREMAGDVAAMANERGGLIVIGVQEHEQMAVDLPGVELSEDEIGRMRQTVTSLCAPHIPIEILAVENPDRPGHGCLGLLIPPSPFRPHAVRKGNDLRYPQRDGDRTRWLSETEVASAYRDRFAQATSQRGRLRTVLSEGLAVIDSSARDSAPWLAVALVPDRSGRSRIDVAAVREAQEWLGGYVHRFPFVGVFSGTPLVGTRMGRITAENRSRDARNPDIDYIELHQDGSAFAATELWWNRQTSTTPLIIDTLLLKDAVAYLRMVAGHATERCGASGDAQVAVCISCPDDTLLVTNRDIEWWSADRADRRHDHVKGDVLAETTVALDDLASPGPRAFAAARLVLTPIVQAFNVPEIEHLTEDGAVHLAMWPEHDRHHIEQSVNQYGGALHR